MIYDNAKLTVEHVGDHVTLTILDITYRMDEATAYDLGKILVRESGWT